MPLSPLSHWQVRVLRSSVDSSNGRNSRGRGTDPSRDTPSTCGDAGDGKAFPTSSSVDSSNGRKSSLVGQASDDPAAGALIVRRKRSTFGFGFAKRGPSCSSAGTLGRLPAEMPSAIRNAPPTDPRREPKPETDLGSKMGPMILSLAVSSSSSWANVAPASPSDSCREPKSEKGHGLCLMGGGGAVDGRRTWRTRETTGRLPSLRLRC